LRDLIAHGKRKLGIVFNLDKHDEPGSHWVSMFVDVDNSFIFYYDSARNNTPAEVTRLKNEITKQGAALSPPIHFKYITNKHSHQRTNTECGMYSLFFIITMLTGKTDHPIESFKKRGHGGEHYGGIREHNLSVEQRISLFLDHNIPDAYVEKYRNTYFN
jgi:Ulp1 family protease